MEEWTTTTHQTLRQIVTKYIQSSMTQLIKWTLYNLKKVFRWKTSSIKAKRKENISEFSIIFIFFYEILEKKIV